MHILWRNLKTKQLSVNLNWGKLGLGDHSDFKMFSVHKARLFQNPPVFEKLSFRDGLVWTVGLTVEIKLRFRDDLVWTVGLTVEIKLRFRDGLVWTVGLTVEIKLRFRDGLVWTVGLTSEIKLRYQISPT